MQDPFEVLVYFVLATIIRGVSARGLSDWTEEQAAAAKAQLRNGCEFEDTQMAVQFRKIFSWEDIDADADGESEHTNARSTRADRESTHTGAGSTRTETVSRH